MVNYESKIVYIPIDDISSEDWDEKVCNKHFECDLADVHKQLKEISPNIQIMSVENLCNQLNEEEFFPSYELNIGQTFFGVIYVKK